jgi:hypothetical protein
MIAAILAGLALGLVHVITGLDHLSAIAPIASVQRGRVWTVGLRWGLGHSLGVVLIGLIAGLLVQITLIDPLSALSEHLVGVMLLAIGGWGLWRFVRLSSTSPSTTVEHHHDDGQSHTHSQPTSGRLAPYAIGILHGCAGGSHLVGVLLALAFPTLTGVFAYLAGFVAGSVLAMTAFAAGIGCLSASGNRMPRAHAALVMVSSLASLGIGCWWLLG